MKKSGYMFRIKKKIFFAIALSLIVISGCVEPFEISPQTFDDVLIVEATLTNEEKTQVISLSRTGILGSTEPIWEEGAEVIVTQDSNNTLRFLETQPGIYESEFEFAALPTSSYQLSITTRDGDSYTSNQENLPSSAVIDDVIARKITNDDGIEGIEIFVNSFDATGQSKFYRYSYEETYKIIAPQWNQFEAFVVSENPPSVDIRLRPQEELICYGNNASSTSILFSTTTLNEDRVSELPIRFIEKSDFIIAHRYSILVKQIVQTEQAFQFYEKLRELSSQGNLLSQSQPGFLIGNVFPDQETSKSVTGYFDVSSVSTKRLFFNFEDFFDDIGTPAYIVGCEQILTPTLDADRFGNSALIQAIQNNSLEFFNDNVGMGGVTPQGEGPFQMVPRICGDCTVIGSNEVPEFWIE
ncbi:DUF4249 domain-containing protein [Flagellimonas eckloniae]|uniref:DUF4249 domain-containing protein n=1 Tax=Flagellimonas eckloniae TaxID=346185 RepID=UPI0006DBF874|nr:DUF4249 domain-containing protein [Allomuricauda eckloniae]